MASWMVHLRIADELLNRIQGLDETIFILGNLAPDSGVPNEDWSAFNPPSHISHFKPETGNKSTIEVDRFKGIYLSDEKIKEYSTKELSFFLGYYSHLLTDVEWAKMVYNLGMTKENAEKLGLRFQDYVWMHKGDWYDLDFLYLEEHPDFRAFHIYEDAKDLTNTFMDIFPKDAFIDRQKYICGFYRSDNHGDLHREYTYLTKERSDRFVDETVEKIQDKLNEIKR